MLKQSARRRNICRRNHFPAKDSSSSFRRPPVISTQWPRHSTRRPRSVFVNAIRHVSAAGCRRTSSAATSRSSRLDWPNEFPDAYATNDLGTNWPTAPTKAGESRPSLIPRPSKRRSSFSNRNNPPLSDQATSNTQHRRPTGTREGEGRCRCPEEPSPPNRQERGRSAALADAGAVPPIGANHTVSVPGAACSGNGRFRDDLCDVG